MRHVTHQTNALCMGGGAEGKKEKKISLQVQQC